MDGKRIPGRDGITLGDLAHLVQESGGSIVVELTKEVHADDSRKSVMLIVSVLNKDKKTLMNSFVSADVDRPGGIDKFVYDELSSLLTQVLQK